MSSQQDALRTLLQRIDGSAQAIQSAASAMMKHYDRSTLTVAVNEWRNSLQGARQDQFLPLLYVVNEVVQTSKRNRGNKFLEAISPVLSQSLQHMCRETSDPKFTEKVRRTVKIWGDRHVFSIRFINELLQGLEPYRTVHGIRSQQQQQHHNKRSSVSSPSHHRPSPSSSHRQLDDELPDAPTSTVSASPAGDSKNANDDDDDENNDQDTSNTTIKKGVDDDDNDDDIMGVLERTGPGGTRKVKTEDDDDDDDDDDNHGGDDEEDDHDVFGNDDSERKLTIELNLDATANGGGGDAAGANASKRRRSSTASNSSDNNKRPKRVHKVALSPNNLLDLWNRLSSIQQRYELSQHVLRRIDDRHDGTPASSLESLVGDELQQAYRQNQSDYNHMMMERRNLHTIAQERRSIESELQNRYIPWLERAIKQDEDDMVFSNALEQKIASFVSIHTAMRNARDQRIMEEVHKQQQQEEQERIRKEKEDAERFRRAALSKVTEARPGMVWNKATQEYQDLNTDEDWRD